jgi:hypothetical protein
MQIRKKDIEKTCGDSGWMFRPVTVVAKITKNGEIGYYLNFQITFAAVLFGVWRSWLAHQHGVLGAGGSSPLTPTIFYLLMDRVDAVSTIN